MNFTKSGQVVFKKSINQQNVLKASRIDGGLYGDLDFIPNVRKVYGADADVLGGAFEIDPVEQDLEIRQASGTHKLNERGPSMSWSITSSDALEDRPNYSLIRFTTLDFAAEGKFQQLRDRANNNFFAQVNGVFPGAPAFGSLDEAGTFSSSQRIRPGHS